MKRVLRYVSDLHLEFYKKLDHPQVTAIWDFNRDSSTKYYLALLGDIGQPLNSRTLDIFLENVSKKYDQVFYVPGNHEYYQSGTITMSKFQIDNILKVVCEKYGVKYLNNDTYILDEFKIIGTTLWSHVDSFDKRYISSAINDYRKIYIDDDDRRITVENTNEWNKESIDFIKSELDDKYKCIVLTHHAPLYSNRKLGYYTADPSYIHSQNNPAFHNKLDDLMVDPIKMWLYGHTHYASKFKFNNVIVATNQLGYASEDDLIDFDPMKSIDLDTL